MKKMLFTTVTLKAVFLFYMRPATIVKELFIQDLVPLGNETTLIFAVKNSKAHQRDCRAFTFL